jgi:hypothetical protein
MELAQELQAVAPQKESLSHPVLLEAERLELQCANDRLYPHKHLVSDLLLLYLQFA